MPDIFSSTCRGPLPLKGNSVGNAFAKNYISFRSVKSSPREIAMYSSDIFIPYTSIDAVYLPYLPLTKIDLYARVL